MKKIRIVFLVVVLVFSCGQLTVAQQTPAPASYKNVILMIMDGTNSDVVTLARWYKGSELALDELIVGGVKTHSLRSAITDSAAAATALATGHKTIVDNIGMISYFQTNQDPMPFAVVPKASVLEAAKRSGMATGLVATAPIQHATPAGFSAHVLDRDQFSDIAEQQVYQGFDVVLGGGKASLLPHNRKDGEDLLMALKEKRYKIITSKEQLESASGEKLWGAFAPQDLAYDIDRRALDIDQPSLAEMTEKAIHTLNQKKKGFFLLVEGSKVDWAAHRNDPVGMISEVLAFDEAVGKAVDFAKADGNTLVIAVTDHGNSGLTIGNRSTDRNYATSPPSKFIEPLKQAKLTVTAAVSYLNRNRSNLVEVASYYGIMDLQRQELKKLKRADSKREIQDLLTEFLSNRAHIGFTTHGHTGEDVFLYAYGPGKPTGFLDNTEIAGVMADYIEVDLEEATDALFVDGEKWYQAKGFDVRIELEGKDNEVLVATKGDNEIRYPKNKNIRSVNGNVEILAGVNVLVGREFYIPRPTL